MGLEVFSNFNWRDALVLVVALLAVYVLVVFLRMRHIKHEKETVSIGARSAVAAYAAASAPEVEAEPEPEPVPELKVVADFPWNEPPPEIPGQERIGRLEREVDQLRSEVGRLRAELFAAREEFRRELVQERATPVVSPAYSDAMQLAMQGLDAATISERCGVARAEAELVVALVRSR